MTISVINDDDPGPLYIDNDSFSNADVIYRWNIVDGKPVMSLVEVKYRDGRVERPATPLPTGPAK